jgi:hypothetical protein
MRFFTDSDTRSRHAFIDATFENTLDQLAKPEIQAHMGNRVTENHKAMVSKLLYAANVRHGRLSLPKDLDNNHVPVIALQHGEKVVVDKRISLQTPIQTETSLKSVRAWMDGDEKQAADFLSQIGLTGEVREKPLIIKGISGQKAVVSRVDRQAFIESAGIGKNIYRHYAARPVMSLVYTPGQVRLTPSALVHEDEHVGQHLFSPVQRLDSQEDAWRLSLRNELEAYAGQLTFIKGMLATGYEPVEGEDLDYAINEEGQAVSFVATIDTLRRETNANRQDKFFPNGTLRTELELVGLDSIYGA